MSIIVSKSNNEMKILSATLTSTVIMLDGLGSFGERVLKEYGVTKIDNDKKCLVI